MKCLYALVLISISRVANAASLTLFEFQVDENNYGTYLYFKTNIDINTEAASPYFRSLFPNVPSEVVFRFQLPGAIDLAKIESSYNHYEMLDLDPASFFQLEVSRGNVNYNHEIASCGAGLSCNSQQSDITSAIFGAKEIFIRARWEVSNLSTVGLDAVKFSPNLLLIVYAIPEPNSLLPLMVVCCCVSYRWTRS